MAAGPELVDVPEVGPPASAAEPAGEEPGLEGHGRERRRDHAQLRTAVLLAATGLVLLGLGGVLGVIGSFLHSAVLHVLGVGVPVGAVLAVVGNLAAGAFGTIGTGSRLGGALPGVGWLIVVMLLGTVRGEGDLVVTGNGSGLAFILLGAAAAAVGAMIAPSSWPNRDHGKRNHSASPDDLR